MVRVHTIGHNVHCSISGQHVSKCATLTNYGSEKVEERFANKGKSNADTIWFHGLKKREVLHYCSSLARAHVSS